jgi:hypothetical protein
MARCVDAAPGLIDSSRAKATPSGPALCKKIHLVVELVGLRFVTGAALAKHAVFCGAQSSLLLIGFALPGLVWTRSSRRQR